MVSRLPSRVGGARQAAFFTGAGFEGTAFALPVELRQNVLMNRIDRPKAPAAYDHDFARWCAEQSALLREGMLPALDRENLAEEIESLGRNQKNEIESRLAILVLHLLKWQFQPGRRSESWRISIGEQRIWIPNIIKHSPSLKSYPARVFGDAYVEGRRQAIGETGLQARIFPIEPPFSAAEALDREFWPGDPFELYEVIRD